MISLKDGIVFYKEEKIKSLKNKAYCIQWSFQTLNPIWNFRNTFNIDMWGISLILAWFGFFCIRAEWTKNQDHAGLELTIDIPFFMFHHIFYDTRHWDDKNDKWEEGK